MAQMGEQLELQQVIGPDPEVIGRNFELIRAAYLDIHNDINTKEWVYFTAGNKKWRTGPDPDGDDYLFQYLDSGDWRVQSNWVTRIMLRKTGQIVLGKAAGVGIQVDPADPTYVWRDLKGKVTQRNTGASKPAHNTWNGGIKQYQFAAGKEEFFTFHIDHDHVLLSDIHLHVHWDHIGTLVTGGTITFEYELSYGKGFDQSPAGTPLITTFTGTASTVQRQMILTEIQVSATAPSAVQIDSADLQPDGVIECRLKVTSVDITVSGGGVPDPFIHECDIHYQSTNTGTKQKEPDFYV